MKIHAMKIVVAAIIQEGSRVLLVRRGPNQLQAGYWEFPGGKLEPGETYSQCIEREIFEELGLIIEAGDQVATSDFEYPNGAIRLIGVLARIKQGSLSLSVHDRYTWALLSELDTFMLAPADIPIANELERLTNGDRH
jgi:mutator protein MutT